MSLPFKKLLFPVLMFFSSIRLFCQPSTENIYLSVTVLNEQKQPLESAVISLFRSADSTLIKTELTDDKGKVVLKNILQDNYYCITSFAGYITDTTSSFIINSTTKEIGVTLQYSANTLNEVTVTTRKPFIQHEQGKVLVNVDASPTNAGTSVLDVLEKSPGVTVDRNGTISLKAKQGVLILIDGKQTYLSGLDLNNLLASMSSSQVEQIELMTNPSARYDASGNAGIINIKTKKSKQKGFNGNITTAYSQGRYPKSNNSLVLNYRHGKLNTFLTYSYNYNRYYSDLYAERKYMDENGKITATLDQPTYFTGTSKNNTLKAGLDFYASPKTNLGVILNGILAKRNGSSDATATWINPDGNIDSSLTTISNTDYHFRNVGINVNGKHSINKKQQISADVDWLYYDIKNQLYFANSLAGSGGYTDASKGDIPSALKIFTAKADYTLQYQSNGKLETGVKSSHINTDNLATYDFFDGTNWKPDYGKSNHFLYTENIYAVYASIEQQFKKITMQLGLRYENTSYEGEQKGNAERKDSSFSRNYDGLFPSGYITWQADSANSFTFTAGRRIDRPAFQRLNPFVFIVNKYTYETGNPYFRPQYSWNMELSHQYKSFLTTTLSYSIIKDYFSQLFLTDSSNILYYSQGNVGKAYIAGLSVSAQLSPFKWWNFNGEVVSNYKKLKGYVWNDYESSVVQFNASLNNLFTISDKYTAELSGFYTGRSRNDLQEALLPTGQLNVGISRTILKKKGTIKLSFRDIFHTQVMEGNTDFQYADEYFIIRRDSRVITLAFTWRFGNNMKSQIRHSGADDEMERVNG